MAIVERFIASVEIWDSAKKLGSYSQYVGAADARAYIAAANQGARDATDVGILLLAGLAMTEASVANNHYKKWSVQCDFVNDAALPAIALDADFRTNRYKVTYVTTNGGIPTVESVYIPMRNDGLAVAADGISLDLSAGAADTFRDNLILTGLSSYGTAITAVNSITKNDI